MRNDPEDVVQMTAAEEAEVQALAWFKKWVG